MSAHETLLHATVAFAIGLRRDNSQDRFYAPLAKAIDVLENTGGGRDATTYHWCGTSLKQLEGPWNLGCVLETVGPRRGVILEASIGVDDQDINLMNATTKEPIGGIADMYLDGAEELLL